MKGSPKLKKGKIVPSYIAEVVLWRVLTSFIGDYYFVEVSNLLYLQLHTSIYNLLI